MVKLQLPERITAEFKIITPMFIGDGMQNAERIYPQSVKGALRFWWRALMWQQCITQTNDDVAALRELHQMERALFGCLPERDEKGSKAAFSLKIEDKEVPKPQREISWPKDGNTSSGYLGMGLWESGSGKNHQPHREGIPKLGHEYSFQLVLTLSNDITAAQKEQLYQTLQLLGLCGGLGSRARRGFGSLQLQKIDGENGGLINQAAYNQAVHQLLDLAVNASLAPYSALSQASAFASVSGFSNAGDAHAELGTMYRNYRGQPSPLRGLKKKVFGLPLAGVDEDVRRASPLFFHIFQTENDGFGYSILHLPTSVFHEKHRDADFGLTAGFLKKAQEV